MIGVQFAQWDDLAENFSLPTYEEIPEIGLFLEQVVRYTGKYTDVACLAPLTGSMVSNYVKKKIITNPIKKTYSREQIAYLLFIAVAKNVIPIEDMQFLFKKQKSQCSAREAYTFFRTQMKVCLHQVAGSTSEAGETADTYCEWQAVVRNICAAAAHTIYLERYIAFLKSADPVE